MLRGLFSKRRVEDVPPAGDSPAGGLHYYFAHKVLPAVFFDNPENFLSRLRREGDKALLESWDRVGRNFEKADRSSPVGLTHEIREVSPDTTVTSLSMQSHRIGRISGFGFD